MRVRPPDDAVVHDGEFATASETRAFRRPFDEALATVGTRTCVERAQLVDCQQLAFLRRAPRAFALADAFVTKPRRAELLANAFGGWDIRTGPRAPASAARTATAFTREVVFAEQPAVAFADDGSVRARVFARAPWTMMSTRHGHLVVPVNALRPGHYGMESIACLRIVLKQASFEQARHAIIGNGREVQRSSMSAIGGDDAYDPTRS